MQRSSHISTRFQEARQGKKMLAVLIDPDSVRLDKLDQLIELSLLAKVDFFFIGGSLIVNNQLDACLLSRRNTIYHWYCSPGILINRALGFGNPGIPECCSQGAHR